MGQKVHPVGMRLGISTDWASKWYAEKGQYADYLAADIQIREFIRKRLKNASVSRIHIERARDAVTITIFTARPGVVIGKKGEDISRLKVDVSNKFNINANINIEEIRKPELDAYLVAESICQQLEKRVMFRRAMKRAVAGTMRLGALGIKVNIAGRLNGAEIARAEWVREGRVPLHTLRANIDYGFAEALTGYGIIGVKVWIYKGESMTAGADLDAKPSGKPGRRGPRKPRRG
ncbi:MAG: 30S ribosomal protein S3 [Gammaproteobacteria bacterium]|nr:MAG: 30S ribosomal protein S3 [Gammaproteobacteria bacterium]